MQSKLQFKDRRSNTSSVILKHYYRLPQKDVVTKFKQNYIHLSKLSLLTKTPTSKSAHLTFSLTFSVFKQIKFY